MSDPRTPQQWRELLRNSYPEDVEQVPGRRERRRAQKEHNRRKEQAARDWVRKERESEPVTGGAVLLIILVVLSIGLISWLVRSSDDQPEQHHEKAERPAAPLSPSSPTGPSPTPSPSGRGSGPEAVARAWAREFFTRDPYKEQTHQAVVDRAARWMTPQLTTNLSESDDPAWGKLVSHGGVSKVTNVKVTSAGKHLPVDTPLRVWRKLLVTTSVHGYDDYNETRTVRVELSRAGDGWQVSRALGA
ncbi:hypothetical protein ABZ569_32210 [Streptomyces albus]|uniref:hypothetical protein n=1 Tax=Streptomyces albus TaxID=1888 RepID=UPI00340B0B10